MNPEITPEPVVPTEEVTPTEGAGVPTQTDPEDVVPTEGGGMQNPAAE